MGEGRPTRSYWPRPGVDEESVIQRGISILTRGRNGDLPRAWASHAKVDGYNFSPKEDAKEAKGKKKDTKSKKKECKVGSHSQLEHNDPETGSPDPTIPPERVEGKYRLVHKGLTDSTTFYSRIGSDRANRCRYAHL